MELTVLWTRFAENKLEDIYNYYKKEVGLNLASKMITNIIDSTISLKHSPRIGQIEHLLAQRKQEFRYLIVKNYKVIYWIEEDKRQIKIANVFDCRQNPIKLSETI
ncbi:MAG: type II toxin-antitoxin system RelE/ParE family toxin [Flavobacteriales bacterium]|nr:type II toxin-antitoxin system RelE/ParE family toxin [Flavobacteriales bacterium]